MKKLLAYWSYVILSLILGGYILLAWQSSFKYSVVLMASFLVFYFCGAINLMGEVWALVATFLLAFSATILNASHNNIIFLFSPIFVIIAIEFFLFYVRRSSRLFLIISGILTGLSMAITREAWIVAPLLVFLILILALAKLGRDWPDIDSTMRRHKIRIMIQQNFTSILYLALAILVAIYIFFSIPYFGNNQQVSQHFFTTNWLLNNLAFRPLGLYFLMLENQSFGFEANWISAIIAQDSSPLILFLVVGAALYLMCLVKSLFASLSSKVNLANYLGIYEQEFFYVLFVAVFGLVNIFNTNVNLIKIILLPYLILISINSIKEWFLVSDHKLLRNISIKISIFNNNFLKLPLKTGALIIILTWQLVATIKNYL